MFPWQRHTKAHFAPGQVHGRFEGGPVNIWYWKIKTAKVPTWNAKRVWHAEALLRPYQDVKAKGTTRVGVWKVVFSRMLLRSMSRKISSSLRIGSIASSLLGRQKDGSGQPKEKGSGADFILVVFPLPTHHRTIPVPVRITRGGLALRRWHS